MRWFFTLLALWSSLAPAATTLFQSPGSSNIEYRATLKGSAQYQSPSQVYMVQHPSAAAREALLKQFAEGQKAFVGRSTEEAHRLFASVAAMATAEDWAEADREVLFTALLRLAQMEKAENARDAWLAQALLLGPGLQADVSLFPPPLLARFKQMESQAPALNPAANLDSGEWTRLLINGVSCTRLECPRFVKVAGRVRLTYLSDKWQPQTLVMDSEAAASAQPERVAWVVGECGKPVFHSGAQAFHEKQAFFNLDCEKPAAVTVAGAAALKLAPTTTAEEVAGFTQAMPQPVKPAFYQSKWFWIGTGVVAVATIAILANQHKSHDEHEPTMTYGN